MRAFVQLSKIEYHPVNIQFCLNENSKKVKNNENNSKRSIIQIYNGQNLSHTNDQIHHAKSKLYLPKNTKLIGILKHLPKKEIFQYFCKDFDLL